jgi:hypothetical protein
MGRSPDLVATRSPTPSCALQSAHARTVRGYRCSMSFIYVIFDDTGIYWAHTWSRAARAVQRLAPDVAPSSGPDATGSAGCQYVIEDPRRDSRSSVTPRLTIRPRSRRSRFPRSQRSRLRRQYQIVLDPNLAAYGLTGD